MWLKTLNTDGNNTHACSIGSLLLPMAHQHSLLQMLQDLFLPSYTSLTHQHHHKEMPSQSMPQRNASTSTKIITQRSSYQNCQVLLSITFLTKTTLNHTYYLNLQVMLAPSSSIKTLIFAPIIPPPITTSTCFTNQHVNSKINKNNFHKCNNLKHTLGTKHILPPESIGS